MSQQHADVKQPQNKEQLLNRIDDAWDGLMHAAGHVDQVQMQIENAEGWSILDHLTHVMFWERLLREGYMLHRPIEAVIDDLPADVAVNDTESLNRFIRTRSRILPPENVMTLLQRGHSELVADLDALQFADTLHKVYPNDPQSQTLLEEIIGNTYDHYAEHTSDIKAILAEHNTGIGQNTADRKDPPGAVL